MLLETTILRNRWLPHSPTPRQALFLTLPLREALFGGSAGGGKSDALLMAALQYADTPGYSAILFRRSYADLALPGAIMDRARSWLAGTTARWNEQKKTFTFPSGATLAFGYLEHDSDRYRYQGAEFHFVGWDELTQFGESSYRYLFSRLRRLEHVAVPIRMRAATNPGGVGHQWVFDRFIDPERAPAADRAFVPSTLDDNPHLDRAEYIASLTHLSAYERAQLLKGDWFVKPPGDKFHAEWFPRVDDYPHQATRCRYWDLAATAPAAGKDPDHTAGALVALHDGIWYLLDIQRFRARPQEVEARIRATAERDGRGVRVRMEQEPGSAGVSVVDHYARRILPGWNFQGVRTTGPKEVRADPVSSAAEAGNVKLLRGPWIQDFLDEATSFPAGPHDDQVDAVSGAFADLSGGRPFAYAVGGAPRQPDPRAIAALRLSPGPQRQ